MLKSTCSRITGQHSRGVAVVPVLWVLLVVVSLLAWNVSLYVLDPNDVPQAADVGESELAVSEEQALAGTNVGRANRYQPSGGSGYPRSDRPDGQRPRTGSSAGGTSSDPGTVAQQGQERGAEHGQGTL